MVDPTTLKFLSVKALLTQATEGLGEGSRQLFATSQTEIGSLHVKEATIHVDFELTSRVSGSEDGIALGAKTLTHFHRGNEAQETNRARIEMRIVTVPPRAPDEKDPPKGGAAEIPGLAAGADILTDPRVRTLLESLQKDPNVATRLSNLLRTAEGKTPETAAPTDGPSKTTDTPRPTRAETTVVPPEPPVATGWPAGAAKAPAAGKRRPRTAAPPAPARSASGATLEQMGQAVAALHDRLLVPGVPPHVQASIAQDLGLVAGLLDAGRLDEAEAALQRFALKYTETFQSFGEGF